MHQPILSVAVGASLLFAACDDHEQPPALNVYAATNPATEPDRFTSQLSHVELIETRAGVEIQAFNASGTVIGVLTLSQPGTTGDETPGYQLSAEYDDGYADYTLLRGDELSAVQTLSDETLARRANAIIGAIDAPPGTETTPLSCALTVAAGAATCGASPLPVKPLTCPGSIIVAICACRDQIKKTTGFDFTICDELD